MWVARSESPPQTLSLLYRFWPCNTGINYSNFFNCSCTITVWFCPLSTVTLQTPNNYLTFPPSQSRFTESNIFLNTYCFLAKSTMKLKALLTRSNIPTSASVTLTIYQNVRQRQSFLSNLTFWECQRITYTSPWVTFQKLAFENSSLEQLILGSSNINVLRLPWSPAFFLLSVKAKQRWSIKCLLSFRIKDKNKRWRIVWMKYCKLLKLNQQKT